MQNKREQFLIRNRRGKREQFLIRNIRGWTRIAEAFVAVLLLASIVLFVISKGDNQTGDISPAVQDVEISILREIQLNSTIRAEVLGTNGEINWTDFPSQVPNTNTKINSRIPNYLNCMAKICDPSGPCLLTGVQEKNIYAESAMITSTLNTFKPRMVKLFCWEK